MPFYRIHVAANQPSRVPPLEELPLVEAESGHEALAKLVKQPVISKWEYAVVFKARDCSGGTPDARGRLYPTGDEAFAKNQMAESRA